jgi:hypothetical protein
MGQRYCLEPAAMTATGVLRHFPLPNLPRFLDTRGLGRRHVETTDIPKATEPSSRAAPSARSEIIRQC